MLFYSASASFMSCHKTIIVTLATPPYYFEFERVTSDVSEIQNTA